VASFKVGEAPWEKQETANSARPSSLPSPVPKEEAPVAEPPNAQGFAVGSAPWEKAESAAAPIADDQFAPEPGFVQANVEQLPNVVTRIQAGLAANDTEKLGFLKNKFGQENATVKNGKLYFRKSADEKFKKLDPDTLELINDIIPDFSREIVTEAAMLPAEIGTAVGLSAIPGGTFAGAAMGRVASTPMANAFADSVAQIANIPQDPNRDKRTENAVGMAVEAVAPSVGKVIVGAVAKRLPGTAAYKAAKEAGEILKFRCPVGAEWKSGKNWYDCH